MEKVSEKMKAVQEAITAIHTVNSVKPNSVSDDVLRLLSELRIDLLDVQDDQNSFDVASFLGGKHSF